MRCSLMCTFAVVAAASVSTEFEFEFGIIIYILEFNEPCKKKIDMDAKCEQPEVFEKKNKNANIQHTCTRGHTFMCSITQFSCIE